MRQCHRLPEPHVAIFFNGSKSSSLPSAPPATTRPGRNSPPGIATERNHIMHTANPAGTHDDPFDLGAVLVIDTAAASTPRRCATDDGCTPTCASSCTSGS